MRKAKEKNKPLLSLAAAGLAALLLFGMATAVLAQGTQGKFVADEWSGIAEADIAEGDSTKDQAENQASTTPTPTPVSTQDESTALSDATPESAESSELTENKETDSDSNAEIPAEVSAFSNDLAVEEVSLYDASGTSAQDAVTSWTELKSAVASAANGATIYLSGEITIPLDEVLSVSKNLRLVGTGSAQYTNTVGVGSETVAQGYTYTQNASLRMGDASGVQTDHDNVMIYISGGTTLEIENVFLNGNNNCENVVYTEGTDSKISLQNCTVGYGNDNGILLNPGQAEINGSLVFNNGEYAGDGTALYRFENGSAVLSGNVRSQGLGGGGLTCAAGSHVQAAASSFVWNKTSGFDIPEADSSASAENCFFWGNGWTGANVRSNSVMTLTGCQVENNGYNTANLLTTDGDTASNTFPGLDVQGAGTMKISHCGILNNAGNGVQCYPDSKTYLYGWNHIYANGINGVYTQGQLWIGKAADSANGDETTAVYNNAADGVHTDGGTVQGDHLNCYGNSYSGISAMKNESLDQTATLELTAPVTSHENGHSGLYLKGGTKATVSGGSFTENGAEHAEIYAGSGTDTTLKDGVEVKTSADKTLQNSGLRIAVMLDGVDVFRTDSTLQIPAGDSIHLKQDADVVTWNGGTREQLGVTCENPWLGRTIIQSDTAVLDWENSRESNNAQTAEQHPENGIDTNVYYTAIEDAYFGMKNSDAHDVWLSYDSFKINGESSVWHWKSRGIGGKSALDYLIYVEGVRFVDAVRLLCEESPAYTEPAHESIERERPPFALPAAAPNNDRIVQYLLGRGVSIPVISYCMEQGILYESTPYHNCVLVGKDENGQPKYAALRGTYQYGRPFKAEASGSDKRYGFCIPPTAESDTVAVFEAAIDAMAEMTLAGSAADKYRLSLGGIYVPEQTHTIKPLAALEEFLRRHPHVVRMELCLDNDPPGRMATAALAEHYGKRYAVAVRLPQLDGADYGDLAQMAMRQKALKRERAEIAR